MNKSKILLSVVLAAATGGAFAQMDTTREQRMDSAYSDYKAKNPSGSSMSAPSTTGARPDRPMGSRPDRPSYDKSFGQNMKAAGSNLKEGGKEVGHDVAQGARKTGHAVHQGASKVADKAKSVTTDKPAPTTK